MKKVVLAKEFVPETRALEKDLNFDSFKEWVKLHKSIKFAPQLIQLHLKWDSLHPSTWYSLMKNAGRFSRKDPGKPIRRVINMARDLVEIFSYTCSKEIESLDAHIRIHASALPHSKQFLLHYAKFKASHFNGASPDLMQTVLLECNVFNVITQKDFSITVQVFEVYCDKISVELDKLELIFKECRTSLVIPENGNSFNDSLVVATIQPTETLGKSCLWPDYYKMMASMKSTVPSGLQKVTTCRYVTKEDCLEVDCEKYHITSNDSQFFEAWIQKSRNFILNRVASSNILRIVFVDGDNGIGSYNDQLQNSKIFNDELYMIFGRHDRCAISEDYIMVDRTIVVPNMLTTKDAADVDFSREALYLNFVLPTDIDFLFISADQFILELALSIRMIRNCGTMIPTQKIPFVARWNVELQRLAQIRHELSASPKWALTKPSRIANYILTRNEKFCCCLEENGLPCDKFRFSTLVTCEVHTH